MKSTSSDILVGPSVFLAPDFLAASENTASDLILVSSWFSSLYFLKMSMIAVVPWSSTNKQNG